MDRLTLARPYARAVYDISRREGSFERWEDFLARLSTIVTDSRVRSLLGNPRIELDAKVKFLGDLACASQLPKGLKLLRQLAEYKRLELIPEILEQYRALAARDDLCVRAEVTVAKATDANFGPIVEALRRRFGRQVHIEWAVAPELIAGAIVRVGDTEIDGSLKGSLTQLRNHLLHTAR
jgi:F-type H+-transporting ATPase subunit delta